MQRIKSLVGQPKRMVLQILQIVLQFQQTKLQLMYMQSLKKAIGFHLIQMADLLLILNSYYMEIS